jgi:hypothetical protein
VRGSVVLVASQGFEPRLIGSEPTVLPLNEEATDRAGAAGTRPLIHADVRLLECTGYVRAGQTGTG